MRWRAILAAVAVYLILGVGVPAGALFWLLTHHESPYAIDARALASPASAFGGHPASLQPASGAFDLGIGRTAVYADTTMVTIVPHARTGALTTTIERLAPRSSSGYSAGAYEQVDLTLSDGRVGRLVRLGDAAFVFLAPTPAALRNAIGRTPSLRPNTRRDVGNVVLDDNRAAAIGIGAGWLLIATIAMILVTMRLAVPKPTAPAPGVPPVAVDELSNRLLALNASGPFVVTAGKRDAEFFVDWRYEDARFLTMAGAGMVRKLFRIRLRLDAATRIVDSTDFESEFAANAGGLTPFANISWSMSRGYVFFEKQVGWINGQSYRFDVKDMRDPIVATIANAGWTYRPQF